MLLVTVVVWLRMAAMGPGLIMQSSAGGNVGGCVEKFCHHQCTLSTPYVHIPATRPPLFCHHKLKPLKPLAQLNAFFCKLPRSWCFCYINKKVTNTLTLF